MTEAIGRRTRLPSVTLLLIFGFVIGPSGLDLLFISEEKWFSTIADMALVMIGFLLGGKFTSETLRKHGKEVLWLSISEVVVTAAIVFIGLILVGIRLDMALLLAGISTATAPAATVNVVQETNVKGDFADILLGIVAVDDAWGLIVFSLIFTMVQTFGGEVQSVAPLLSGAWELGGSFLVGIGLGIPMAYLTGRVRPGEPTLIEALGMVFLCGGIAIWLHVSFLLSSMIMGCVVANLARHHSRPFHAIENIEWPFMILFFVLAGASLQPSTIPQLGLLGSGYIIFRVIGRILGGVVGGAFAQSTPQIRKWMGMALTPQAGVALGMALVAAERSPQIGAQLLPVVIASTIVFEVIGPILTRTALTRSGEA